MKRSSLKHLGSFIVGSVLALGVFCARAAEPFVEHPVPRAAPRMSVVEEDLPRAGGILVFGGTRGVGLELVKQLVARNDKVTVMVRPNSDTKALEALKVSLVVGDALKPEQIKQAYTTAPFRAAVSVLGGRSGEQRPDFEGNKNVIDATKAAGIERFILVSTVGAGDSAEAAPWLARMIVGEVMGLKTQAENYLKASGLKYTIVRPGGLKDKPATGTAVLTTDRSKFGYVMRADVAKLLVDCIADNSTIGKVYTAFDPAMEGFWSIFK